ncbi:hypothetical protein OHV05_38175 (plasmid) [Kitasatospora sp. NBC_00070]|uniref:hypothetical protein n=1 Tax=Kitasatospora sp. NBC_00070 TaxID=2975962 RepID=UPI002F90ACE1
MQLNPSWRSTSADRSPTATAVGTSGADTARRFRTRLSATLAGVLAVAGAALLAPAAHADAQPPAPTLITAQADNTVRGYNDDGSSAGTATFTGGSVGTSVALDPSGNKYVIPACGSSCPYRSGGDVYKISSTGQQTKILSNRTEQVAADDLGNIYVTAPQGINGSSIPSIAKIDASGNITVIAQSPKDIEWNDGTSSTFHNNTLIYGVAVDGSGNVYFNDLNGPQGNQWRLWKIPFNNGVYGASVMIGKYTSDPGCINVQQTWCEQREYSSPITVDSDGNVYTGATVGLGGLLYQFPVGGGQPVNLTPSGIGTAKGPTSLATDSTGVYATRWSVGQVPLTKFTKNAGLWTQSTVANTTGAKAVATRCHRPNWNANGWDRLGTTTNPLTPGSAYSTGTGTSYRLLAMHGDGNLVMYNYVGQAVWSTNTWGHPGAKAVMDNGQFKIVDTIGATLWSAISTGDANSTLSLDPNDGILRVKNTDTKIRWSSGFTVAAVPEGSVVLEPGQGVGSGDRQTVMQYDGNLVTYDKANVPKWASNTWGHPGAKALFVNGMLSVDLYWGTNTGGSDSLIFQNDGNIIIKNGTTVTWTSGGN